MTAARAILTLSLTALLAGCGNPVATAPAPAPAAHVATVTPSRAATPAPAPVATAAQVPVATAAPTPASRVPAAVAAPPAGAPVIVALRSDGSTTSVTLLSTSGNTLATATAPTGISWDVHTGPGGAFWEAGGRLHRLAPGGAVSDLGPMPPGADFAVSPDGRAVVYATTTQPVGSPSRLVNQLFVLRGGLARLIASRDANSQGPSGDAPAGSWLYRIIAWLPEGILIAREPQGGCGCAAFGMESVDDHTALVDPVTGDPVDLPTTRDCPLSGVGPGEVACFHVGTAAEGRPSDALHIASATAPTQVLTLSGTTVAGDAVFSTDGTRLAYATAPATSDCGTWESQTTMRVLDLATGSARALGGAGLQPVAWLADGRVLATRAVGTTGTDIVLGDPARGTVTTLRSLAAASVLVRLASA